MLEKENPPFFKGLRFSLNLAGLLLIIDVVFLGDFIFCPVICLIWLLYAIVKALLGKERALACKMMLIIAVTLGIALGNAWLQSRVAHAHAKVIIQAYEQYRAKNGVYPKGLYDLVPEYMPSVPRAKYSFMFNEFFTYSESKDQHALIWVGTPIFGFPRYDFEKAQWGLGFEDSTHHR